MGREIRQRNIIALSSGANLLGTAVLAIAGWYGWSDYNRNAIALLVIGALLLALTPLATALFTIKSEAASAEKQERLRALVMFIEITHRLFKMPKSADLRATLLIVEKEFEPAIFKQLVRWDNTGQKNPGTSIMTIQQGVAGKCYREVGVATASFETGDFIQHMVDLGFTKVEARQFEVRGAYLCAPVVDSKGEVFAVLSMDTKDANAFTVDHTEVAEWITPFFAKLLTDPEKGEADHG